MTAAEMAELRTLQRVSEQDRKKLWDEKASKESVENLSAGLEDLKEAFESLKRIMIGAALSWVAGSGMFLLAVLTLKHG